jgi:integrase
VRKAAGPRYAAAEATTRARLLCFARLAHKLSGLGYAARHASGDDIPRVRRLIADVAERGGLYAAIELSNHLCKYARRFPSGRLYTKVQAAREGLLRLRPFFPPSQARPLPAAAARRLESLPPSTERLVCQLMWHAAARLSDLSRLRARDILPESRGWVTLRYRHTKTAQRGTVRMARIQLPRGARRLLRAAIESAPPLSLPLNLPATRITAYLHHHFPGYSSRSFRRGAVQAMLDRGVDERDVVRLTGHASVETLLIYADRLGRKGDHAMRRCATALTGRTAR